jgi:uncharacterized protein (DUF4415 family)
MVEKRDAMSKKPEKPPHISQKDWDDADIPEWAVEDFARAKPFSEVFPEQFKTWKRMGRPPVENPKVHISFRLASDVVDGIRATGEGYNARVEKVLRDALKRGELKSQQNLPTLIGEVKRALDEENKEPAAMPERISERRTQLQEELDELEIVERVLVRFGKRKTAERPARAASSPTSAERSARSTRQRP